MSFKKNCGYVTARDWSESHTSSYFEQTEWRARFFYLFISMGMKGILQTM